MTNRKLVKARDGKESGKPKKRDTFFHVFFPQFSLNIMTQNFNYKNISRWHHVFRLFGLYSQHSYLYGYLIKLNL